MPTYTVTARVVLNGATMQVEAESEEEARRKAEAEPDFEFGGADMVDWSITDAADVDKPRGPRR